MKSHNQPTRRLHPSWLIQMFSIFLLPTLPSNTLKEQSYHHKGEKGNVWKHKWNHLPSPRHITWQQSQTGLTALERRGVSTVEYHTWILKCMCRCKGSKTGQKVRTVLKSKKKKNCGTHLTLCTKINLRGIININQRRQWHPTPVLLPRKSRGRRSLVGCSPC